MDPQTTINRLERLLGKKVVTNLLQQEEKYGEFYDDNFVELLMELTKYCLIEMKLTPLKELAKRYDLSYFKLNKLLAIVKVGLEDESKGVTNPDE